MGRTIEGVTRTKFHPTEFHPMVGIRTVGNFVKGTVTAMGQTTNRNPVVTLALIDLDGTTSKSVSKGVYEEVDVNIGDSVQVIGSVQQLREKLPQLAIGDVVTITFTGKKKLKGGKSLNEYTVLVD